MPLETYSRITEILDEYNWDPDYASTLTTVVKGLNEVSPVNPEEHDARFLEKLNFIFQGYPPNLSTISSRFQKVRTIYD